MSVSATGAAAWLGLIVDTALGGLAIKEGFDAFRKGRDPDETEDDAAQEYAREMLAQVTGEQEADDAVAAWRAVHGQGT